MLRAGPLASDDCRTIDGFIRRYELHSDPLSLPVPIRQVVRDEGWHVRYDDQMAELFGVAVVRGPVRVMTINCNVSPCIQRAVMAHELAHILLGHRLTLDLAGNARDHWTLPHHVDLRQELQAWSAAACILIPEAVMFSGLTYEEIAAQCGVPLPLVETRREVWQPANELPWFLRDQQRDVEGYDRCHLLASD